MDDRAETVLLNTYRWLNNDWLRQAGEETVAGDGGEESSVPVAEFTL